MMIIMTFSGKNLKEMVYEVNSYDGSLEEFDYRYMGALNEVLRETKPAEILSMGQFGQFDLYDDMFKINEEGHLESCSTFSYMKELVDNSRVIVGRYNELVEYGDIDPIE